MGAVACFGANGLGVGYGGLNLVSYFRPLLWEPVSLCPTTWNLFRAGFAGNVAGDSSISGVVAT